MDIKKREDKIKEKRKQTSFRDFVKEITSWFPLMLYKDKGMITRYHPSDRATNIIENEEYNKQYSDGTPPLNYNLDKSFFDNFGEFFKTTPKSNLLYFGSLNENVHFCEAAFGAKNGYLTFVLGAGIDGALYSSMIYTNCKNVFNSVSIMNDCDTVYMSRFVTRSFKIFYSQNIHNCSNIWFSKNLQGCHDCIFCDGLENQSFCIKNKQYPKEEYLQNKKEILSQKETFDEQYINSTIGNKVFASKNVTGGPMAFCQDIENGYTISRVTQGRNAIHGEGVDDTRFMYDVMDFGLNSTHFYGVLGAGEYSENLYLTSQIAECSNIYYSYFLGNCSYCLGCIGLKNKQFCILNKEYSREEWFKLANEIFAQMDKEGVLGNFFPAKINPFYFNDTAAYLIDDSFTKEEVTKEGYLRRDKEIKIDTPEGAEVVQSHKVEGQKSLDDFQGFDENGKWNINPEILKKVIKDEKGNYYRIVQMEYDFLMKHGLPLPQLHRLERIKLGFKFK